MLALGPRRSEQDYASDDKALLASLATQAAPALRVAQLVRQQRAEARERERITQELKAARLIQQTLLPRAVPTVPGWGITPYYEPAREVGGDFYDFIALPDGLLGLVIADVTDKGVPAALVMATTRSVLRGAATRLESPGAVLARVNDMLVPEIPPNGKLSRAPLTGVVRARGVGWRRLPASCEAPPRNGGMSVWSARAGHRAAPRRGPAGDRSLTGKTSPG